MVSRSMVKDTMEYQWRGQQWKLYLVIFGVVMLFTPMVSLFQSTTGIEDFLPAMLISAAIYGVIFLPAVLYPMFRQWQLLQRCDHYRKYSVKLCNPVTSMLYKGAVYYRVVFQTEDGETVVCNTSPMFSSAIFAAFVLEDYNNKTVDIYYDEEKHKVILVGNRR